MMPADLPLSETSLAEAADTIEVVERAEPFHAAGHSAFGLGFSGRRSQIAFTAVDRTTEIRQYHLSQVHLDTACMVLIKDGKKTRQTDYLIWPKEYEDAKVIDNNIVYLDDSEYILGCNRGWGNYFHWMTQCLPAIDASLRHSRSGSPTLALRQLGAWQSETLQLLGYSKIPRLTLDPSNHYRFSNLTYSEFLSGSTAFGISRVAGLAFGRLRDAVVDGSEPPSRDIIYVARSDSTQRPMTNDAEVISRLEKLGAHIVVPGRQSVAEQISLFDQAAIVVGAHGAGLTNVVFCRPGAVLYEIHPSFYLNPCFWRLAQVAGLDYHTDIFGDEATNVAWIHDLEWSADPDAIEAKLYELRARLEPRGAVASIDKSFEKARKMYDKADRAGVAIRVAPAATIATDSVTIESMVEFRPAARISLGTHFMKSGAAAMFAPQNRTAAIQMHTIENATFYGGTLAMVANERLVESSGMQDIGRACDGIVEVGDDQRVVIACNPPWKNYYHWMSQCIPAIDWAIGIGGTRGLRIAVPALEDWQETVLKILAYDRIPRLQIESGFQYRLRRAIYSDFFLGRTSFSVSGAVLATIKRIENSVPIEKTDHPLVYIKAHDQFYGNLENEDALITLLTGMGFHIADISTHTVAEQINLFRDARLVVAPHGFAMTNVAFCNPTAAVWELFPSHYTNACYNRLAQAAGIEYWADLFESGGGQSPQGWSVDINLVATRLHSILLRECSRFLLAHHRHAAESARDRGWSTITPLDSLLRGFESLGEDCEFGLVQREVGIEQLGLLRFASFYFPLEQRLSRLIAAIEHSFEGFGETGNIQVRLEGEPGRRKEFMAYERRYDILYHTNIHEGDDEPERLERQQERVLQFLRRKMLDDLRTGEKIWVWKTRLLAPTHDVIRLHNALQQYGPNRLLWVSHETEAHAAGDIELIRDRLWRGYVEPCSTATKFVAGPWYAVCRKADQLERIGASSSIQ